jgi:hypothetical protein
MARFSRRKTAAALGFLAAALLAAYAIWWHYAAGWFDRSLAEWAAQRRAEGYRIEMTLAPAEGFPLWLRSSVRDPSVVAPKDAWRWAGPVLHLRSRPWSPLDFAFEPEGAQQFSLNDRDFTLESGNATGRIAYTFGGRLADFGLALEAARLTEAGKPPMLVEYLKLGARQPPPDHGEVAKTTLAFEIEATNMTLPETMRPALGPSVAAASFTARLSGPLVPGPLPEALAAWRDAGGALDLDRFQVTWGPLKLRGDATIALDERLQPLIAASCEIYNVGPTFDALIAAGVIDREHGALGKQLLVGMAGEDGRLDVPLTLQDGFVYLGPFKLAPVPPIAW